MLMPWCPSCKTEYQEGILQCADCGAMLMEEFPQDMVCITTLPEEAAQGLLAYYEYLGVDYSILEYDRDSDKYRVLVPRQKEEEILKPTADYFAKQTKEQPAPSVRQLPLHPLPHTGTRGSGFRRPDPPPVLFSLSAAWVSLPLS